MLFYYWPNAPAVVMDEKKRQQRVSQEALSLTWLKALDRHPLLKRAILP